jgi:hypothetical protein
LRSTTPVGYDDARDPRGVEPPISPKYPTRRQRAPARMNSIELGSGFVDTNAR